MENSRVRKRILQKQLPGIRRELILSQHGVCPICGHDLTRIKSQNQVIDHNHETGIIRAVLHRGCNRVEGAVFNAVHKWGKASTIDDVIFVLRNLIAFWELHKKPQTNYIYYTYKTPAEKRKLYNARARKRRKLIAKKDN